MRLLVQNVHKRFGKLEALKGVSLELAPGEILGLLGPNGAGKTTLIKIVLGLLLADGGEVVLEEEKGEAEAPGPRVRRPPGGKPQPLCEPLPPHQRPLLRGHPGAFLPRRCGPGLRPGWRALASWTASTPPWPPSPGGCSRRPPWPWPWPLTPRFLLLDEPTLGLDPVSRKELEAILLDLKGEGWGILLTSHDLESVERVSDRVVFLHRGEVLREGSTRALLA
jgi:ABC-2 type transport system ATP-binding protein